jgi:hypothetical protein
MHAWLVEHGLSSPYGAAVAEAVVPDRLTTRVEVGRHVLTARQALRAHRSQVAVDEPWFFAVPDEAIVDVYPWEDFQLLATKSDRVDPESPESDLLACLA